MEIILINGETVLVDDFDYGKLLGHRWFCSNQKGLLYARRNVRGQKNKKILMHREILGLNDPKVYVDHIDGNGLNNQRSNLRICNQQQNMANRRKILKGSSQYKGVSRRGKNWRVIVGRKSYGTFPCEKEAAIAYNFIAFHNYGEYAKLNPIHI